MYVQEYPSEFLVVLGIRATSNMWQDGDGDRAAPEGDIVGTAKLGPSEGSFQLFFEPGNMLKYDEI